MRAFTSRAMARISSGVLGENFALGVGGQVGQIGSGRDRHRLALDGALQLVDAVVDHHPGTLQTALAHIEQLCRTGLGNSRQLADFRWHGLPKVARRAATIAR